MAEYVTVEQLRDEGVSLDVSDAQLTRVIRRASAQIDAWCHRWFSPRAMTLLLDGPGHDILQIGPPIISVSRVRIVTPGDIILPIFQEIVDLTNVKVFNRHLTQGLTDPDDRANPKLQWILASDEYTRRLPDVVRYGWWPRGVQNIEVTGYFGYTDPDPDEIVVPPATPVGKTPELVAMACMMLVVRDMLPVADLEGRTEAALSGRTLSVRTRDQSITYGAAVNSTTGVSTGSNFGSGIMGNTEIQALLSQYVRGPHLGAV